MHSLITYIEQYPLLAVLICSLPSYLIGSISFARLINFLVTRKKEVDSFAEPVPHSSETFESDLVSATLITKQLGPKYGCLTSVLDMVKLVLPTLAVKLLFTSQPLFLLTALTGIAGHNYPVYYRFKGGRGESPLIGALVVISWPGLIISNIAAIIAGFITGSVLVVRWGGYFFMIFWLWYYFRNIWYVIFMVTANILFYVAMSKDLARFRELKKKKGIKFTEEDVSEFILMGKSLGRSLDRYSLYALFKRTRQGNSKMK